MDEQVTGASPGPEARARIFVSYSHDDADAVAALGVQLAFYRDDLDLFVDTHELQPGGRFDAAIDAAIDGADFAVLIVSPSFHASAYIRDHELPRLQTRGIDLAWVLCRPCPWDRIDAVRDRNALHELQRERGGGPISLLAPNEQEAAWYDIARAVAAKARSVLEGRDTSRPEPGELHAVPHPPLRLLDRLDEQDALVRALVDPDGPPRVIAVGPAGSGKSVLAAAVVHRAELRERFPDGVHWLAVGRDADGASLLRRLARQLGLPDAAERAVAERAADAVERVREALAPRQLLLVADDVWSPALLDWLSVIGPASRLLVTSPDPAVARALDGRTVEVGPLDATDAARFLQEATGEPPPADALGEILRLTDGVAAGLAAVAGTVRAGAAWPDVLARTDPPAEGAAPPHRDPVAAGPSRHTLVEAVERSVAVLDATATTDLRRRYAELAVFAPNVGVPLQVVADVWATGADDAAAAVAELHGRTLLHDVDARIVLDDQQAAAARRQARALRPPVPLRELHRRVLDAARRRLPEAGRGWGALPPDAPYLRDQLFRHLVGADDPEGLADAAADHAWLVRRIWRVGDTSDAENDLALAVEVLGAASAAAARLRRLRQRAGNFHRLPDERSVAATVAFQLDVPLADEDTDDAVDEVWLGPLDPSPPPPDALVRVVSAHAGAASGCAFGPDGQTLATCGWDGTVRLFDPRSGRLSRPPLPGDAGALGAIEVDPGGTMVAATGRNGGIRLWDAVVGRLLGGEPGSAMETAHPGGASACAFSPDGRLLASAGEDGRIRLWELPSCSPHGPAFGSQLDDRAGTLTCCRFLPNGSGLVVGSRDGTMRCWDLAGSVRWSAPGAHPDGITACACSPDGRLLATGGLDRTVRLWGLLDGRPAGPVLRGHTEAVSGCVFSPDGAALATTSLDRTARLWDVGTGRAVGPALTDGGDPLTGCAFSPDGAVLATTAADGTVALWDREIALTSPGTTGRSGPGDPTDLTSPAIPAGAGAPTSACGVSADGAVVAGVDRDGRLTVRTGADGRLLGEAQLATPLAALDVSDDGALLTCGGDDGVLHLREHLLGEHLLGDLRARLPLGAAGAETVAVTAIAHGPGGWLAVAGDDGGWRRVEVDPPTAPGAADPPRARVVATTAGHDGPLGAVAVSPDGRWVATGGWDGLVRLWEAGSGVAVGGPLTAHTDTVTTCAFSPDGALLASGSWDGTVVLWDVPGGQRHPALLDAHTDWVTAAAFAPGGRLLLTASNDERIRLWDPRDGTCLLTLQTGRPLGCLAVAGSLVVAGVGRHLLRFRLQGPATPPPPGGRPGPPQ